eukprot:6182406-Pleurochrysis_carterae.AAC.4
MRTCWCCSRWRVAPLPLPSRSRRLQPRSMPGRAPWCGADCSAAATTLHCPAGCANGRRALGSVARVKYASKILSISAYAPMRSTSSTALSCEILSIT